ncbi:MAG: DJ-1/PfpI family protein [Cyanobacteriota bacterium]|nr:DJ-1/PfpI family protein [Cyanobacteriota bacterium]
MVRVLLPLVDGFEEIEAVTVIDILRRAEIEVVVAALGEIWVTGSHGIVLKADTGLGDLLNACGGSLAADCQQLAKQFDGLVLPGGPGTATLQADGQVGELVRAFADQNRWLAAICAAPMVLAQQGILQQKAATSYFSREVYQQARAGQITLNVVTGPIADYQLDPVVVDGNVITSRGAGTAVAFALALVQAWLGESRALAIAQSIHAPWPI